MSGQDTIYQMVTDRILAELEKGTVPWRKSWDSSEVIFPRSLRTGKGYRGVNVFLLMLTAQDKGYSSPFWGTYDHIAECAGMEKQEGTNNKGRKYTRWISPDGTDRGVRKGEKGTWVVYWVPKTRKGNEDRGEDPDKTYRYFLLGYHYVYNVEQADGLPEKYFPQPSESHANGTNDAAEGIMRGYLSDGPTLAHGGDKAYYQPSPDRITLPPKSVFKDAEHYYSTAFHEMGHSTGHKSRLNRTGVENFDHFGSDQYGKEELVAEMTAAMLTAVVGIDVIHEDNAAYVAGWLKTIRGDSRLVVKAAGQAQKAADLIRGIEFESDEPTNGSDSA